MPVQWPEGCTPDAVDFTHSCMTYATHLKLFADWLLLPIGVASIGDLLIWAARGAGWYCLAIWVAFVIKDHSGLGSKIDEV